MTAPVIDQAVPDFTANATSDTEVKLSTLRGKKRRTLFLSKRQYTGLHH